MDKSVATSAYPETMLAHVGAGKAFGKPLIVMAGFRDQVMEGQRALVLTNHTGC
ncbi:hypothetical protein [Salinivibrio costicola]|uniref:Uncharacterized protein n=1 Tax=Salinivibrio costicola TaxID=51367 RepID=A0ABX6K9U3_SALCS|nr:hypothetical protein [Salinivibrio costicola]QIR07884.1 hypothetical protein HBA18_15995 [Salinivibrio costicola]